MSEWWSLVSVLPWLRPRIRRAFLIHSEEFCDLEYRMQCLVRPCYDLTAMGSWIFSRLVSLSPARWALLEALLTEVAHEKKMISRTQFRAYIIVGRLFIGQHSAPDMQVVIQRCFIRSADYAYVYQLANNASVRFSFSCWKRMAWRNGFW